MCYLLDLLCSNFTPLRSIDIDLVGSYGKKALEHIGHAYFWLILSEKFQWSQQRDAFQGSQEETLDRLIFFVSVADVILFNSVSSTPNLSLPLSLNFSPQIFSQVKNER